MIFIWNFVNSRTDTEAHLPQALGSTAGEVTRGSWPRLALSLLSSSGVG